MLFWTESHHPLIHHFICSFFCWFLLVIVGPWRLRAFNSLCILVTRSIWLDRNTRVFRGQSRLPSMLIESIVELWELWCMLGSTVGFCWDRPSALAGIDRRLWEALGRSTSHNKQRKKKMNSSRDKSCAQTQQRTHAALCISLDLSNNDEYMVFL
jgi:hypothetical protein